MSREEMCRTSEEDVVPGSLLRCSSGDGRGKTGQRVARIDPGGNTEVSSHPGHRMDLWMSSDLKLLEVLLSLLEMKSLSAVHLIGTVLVVCWVFQVVVRNPIFSYSVRKYLIDLVKFLVLF